MIRIYLHVVLFLGGKRIGKQHDNNLIFKWKLL